MGLQLQHVMVPEAESINSQALAGLSAHDIHVTRRTLLAMADNLRQPRPKDPALEPHPHDHVDWAQESTLHS